MAKIDNKKLHRNNQHPEFYDRSLKTYRDPTRKANNWQPIGTELRGNTVRVIQKSCNVILATLAYLNEEKKAFYCHIQCWSIYKKKLPNGNYRSIIVSLNASKRRWCCLQTLFPTTL